MFKNKEKKMITLTEKEKILVQHLLDDTGGTDAHICNKDWDDHNELSWTFETYRGVFGSIIDKGLLSYSDQNENGEIYRWTYPVDYEQHGNANYEIKTTAEYLTAFENKMTSEKIEKLEKENQ